MRRNHSICEPGTPRVLITGSPAIFPGPKIPDLVHEAGGVVVADASHAGAWHPATCIRSAFSPGDDRLAVIERKWRDYSVNGVLYQALKGCVIHDFEFFRVEKAMREKNIPMIRIEIDCDTEDFKKQKIRINAFIEMLRSKKRKPYEKGIQFHKSKKRPGRSDKEKNQNHNVS